MNKYTYSFNYDLNYLKPVEESTIISIPANSFDEAQCQLFFIFSGLNRFHEISDLVGGIDFIDYEEY